MVIEEMTEKECVALVERSSLGRLGCALDDQPYIVPVTFAYEDGFFYVLSTFGRKIEWMRSNPKVCLAVDEIRGETQWASVIANGEYEELQEPRYTDERRHARELLDRQPHWWQTPFAERQAKEGDRLVDPVFFRIRVSSMSGLQARR